MPQSNPNVFFLPMDQQKEFLEIMEKYGFQNSDPEVNQVVHSFDSNQSYFSGPFLILRRKMPRYSQGIHISEIESEEFLFESEEGTTEKRNKSLLIPKTLKEFLAIANKRLEGKGIRPFFVIEYKRQSFFKQNKELEIFLDKGVRIYYLHHNVPKEFKDYDKDDYGNIFRIKIIANSNADKDFCNNLLFDIEAISAKPIVSTRKEALNSYSEYIYSMDPLPDLEKEFDETEIEAKISLDQSPNSSFFIGLHDLFHFKHRKSHSLSLKSPLIYPFASINHYFEGDHKDNWANSLKILSQGMFAQPVLKGDAIDLGNGIIERREVEKDPFLWENHESIKAISEFENLKHIGFVKRLREFFYVQNNLSKRIYCISLDKCISNEKTLYQIEIEYIGVTNKRNAFNDILKNKVISDKRYATEENDSRKRAVFHEIECEYLNNSEKRLVIYENIKKQIIKDILEIKQEIISHLESNDIKHCSGEEKISFVSN